MKRGRVQPGRWKELRGAAHDGDFHGQKGAGARSSSRQKSWVLIAKFPSFRGWRGPRGFGDAGLSYISNSDLGLLSCF